MNKLIQFNDQSGNKIFPVAAVISNNSNGYYAKIGSLIIQWGMFNTGTVSNTSYSKTVTLPTSFSNTNFQVMAVVHDPGQGTSVLNNGVGTTAYTKTSFEARIKRGNNTNQFELDIRWIAIGT